MNIYMHKLLGDDLAICFHRRTQIVLVLRPRIELSMLEFHFIAMFVLLQLISTQIHNSEASPL